MNLKTGYFVFLYIPESTKCECIHGAMRLTCIHGTAEEAECLIVIYKDVAFKAKCFEASFNLDPAEEPAVSTVNANVNCCDTADTGASTRHAEDVQANI